MQALAPAGLASSESHGSLARQVLANGEQLIDAPLDTLVLLQRGATSIQAAKPYESRQQSLGTSIATDNALREDNAPRPDTHQHGASQSASKVTARADGNTVTSNFKQTKGETAVNKAKGATNTRPCSCQSHSSSWVRPSRNESRCIFIDLGAADGNTFMRFLANDYGVEGSCGNHTGRWDAFLIEANPYFTPYLKPLAQNYSPALHEISGKAAYMCEGFTSFNVKWDPKHHHWGSSMDSGREHQKRDWRHMMRLKLFAEEGLEKVTVPTININKLIYENTIPADQVILKMDIEGAEYDVVPCLAHSPAAYLVDQLFLEMHPIRWQVKGGNTTAAQMLEAKKLLESKGVRMPKYFSKSL